MGRKVFISVLGTSFYEKCKYASTDFCSGEVRFIQEATLLQIGAQNWSNTDSAFILLTQNAKKTNWDCNLTERLKNYKAEIPEPYEGLESRIAKIKLPFEVVPLNIPDGKNEVEMWEIFNILFDKIKEGDELYFDLTHSFRYLPMLILVLGNYVKFLKNANVVHISYGNYEARNRETNVAPIIDLLPISALQDWTFASANYLENGNVNKLVKLCNQELKPFLKDESRRTEDVKTLSLFIRSLEKVIEERQTCRGVGIIKSNNLKTLKKTANQLPKTLFEPLNPVFNKIKESLSDFDEKENVMNGFAAAKWCYNFGLYQQSATILQENIVSYLCLRHNIKYDDEKRRELINKAFNITSNNLKEEKWKIDSSDKENLKLILSDELFQNRKLVDIFSNLTDLRNDINHSGMRSKKDPLNPQNIIKNINACLISIENILTEPEKSKKTKKKKSILINLSNHPSDSWESNQIQSANKFGDIIDIPFPEIDPEWDETQIEAFATEYLIKIKDLSEQKAVNSVVHLMGEYNFCFSLVSKLKAEGIDVLVSTSQRQSIINEDGTKTIKFSFVQFRKY